MELVAITSTVKPGPDLSILPQRNSAGFGSTRGVGSHNTAHIPANGLRAVIHRLFAAPGGKMFLCIR